VEKLLSRRTNSNFKDKINIISLILVLILGMVLVLFYLIEDFETAHFETAQIVAYPLGFTFLAWFATRRNGCGSCNQVS
jgi:nitrate reductase gamma subunit